MWLSTPSTESITRPRLTVAIVSAVAAASIGYYAYVARTGRSLAASSGGGLHRSNAIRRTRRSRRSDTLSSSSSEVPGDENAEVNTAAPLGDWEQVADSATDDWWDNTGGIPTSQRAGHNIVNLLFRVSEDNARRNGCVHRGCQCNACGMVPIRGVRYRCANCADFDLCETCEAQGIHIKTHVFYKIRVPAPPFGPRQMQPVWYTGDPDTCRRNLPRGLIAKLSRDTGFERPELEAFWEQWSFMANTEWRDDPDDLCVAMDRKTFERCLVPTGGSRHAAPNLIHDRMFSFYDSNNDDLIGFTEFLHGLSYRKRKDKLHKVFEGYDIDADGYVDRRDFLRMFRAYYVLYKQMHKDILDGLEDQLLAGTEAQQLVTSRQPLSSLFGREGRVPSGDGSLRPEGKTFRPDGTVEVAEGYKGAVVEDRGDTASREEILTNLFAFSSDGDMDNSWRMSRRPSGSDTDRAYLVNLIEPPTTLEELPRALVESPTLEFEELDDGEDEDNEDMRIAEDDVPIDPESPSGHVQTESEARASHVARRRLQVPKMEKQRRDLARRQMHDRWRRRQFYLDEEEGGLAPEDWEDEEDILVSVTGGGESSKSAEANPLSPRSRSSSKVRFAEDMDDFETRSNPSTSSRSIPERWGGFEIPDAERDAGKEVLYQVTQQAFNELLDTIFKPAEDLAVQAAETKEQRERYKDVLDTIELPDDPKDRPLSPGLQLGNMGEAVASSEEILEELLAETGYTVELQEPRNAVDLNDEVELIFDEMIGELSPEPKAEPPEPEQEEDGYRDPTLPQFRPNGNSYEDNLSTSPGSAPIPEAEQTPKPAQDEEPTQETLVQWKRLTIAEEHAAKRGGWGKLSFEEFEDIYNSQEHQGNRLDYLGSWIDFCIP